MMVSLLKAAAQKSTLEILCLGVLPAMASKETIVQKQALEPETRPSPSPLTDALRAGLRRATPADAQAARDLTRAAYGKWTPILGREAKPMTADYDSAVREHVVDLLYADGDGEPAALIEMRPETDHLLIVNVAVSPKQQGKGYGRALLAHAEEFCRSLGLDELRLYTSVRLTENVKLYQRFGYHVDREEEASAHLGIFTYMSKRLV
jgi:ribosomal protein S18 acetylase RimI-like enzyme